MTFRSQSRDCASPSKASGGTEACNACAFSNSQLGLKGACQMEAKRFTPSTPRIQQWFIVLFAAACVLLLRVADAQGLTGAFIGTVKDEQGAVIPGAVVRVASPALIGGSATISTNDGGQLRFPVLAPGTYVLDVELPGF